MNYELGEILFERDFESHDDGNVTAVKLRLSRPQLVPERSWCCLHQILGIGNEKVVADWGVDFLQALLLRLQRVDAVLGFYARVYRQKITWLGQDDLDLPVMKPLKVNDENAAEFEEILHEAFQGKHRTPPKRIPR